MANFTFNTYLDELDIASDGWIVTQLSSTQITLEGAEHKMVLTGTGFSVNASGDPLGTISSLKLYGYDYATGSPVETLIINGTNLNHSLAGFVAAAEEGYSGGVDFLLNGNDSLTGSSEDDEISGYAGNDTLNGGDGDDELYGDDWDYFGFDAEAGGADVLNGGNGNDELSGGAGADTMRGGAGDDIYMVDNAGDRVEELAGQGTRDRVEVIDTQGLLSYTLAANVENLSVLHYDWKSWETGPTIMTAKGNSLANKVTVDPYRDMGGKEKLYGLGGNDRLSSGGGNDTLDGGAGNDIMLGGSGSDTYYVDSNLDKVLEGSIANPESIDIDTVFYTVGTAGATASLGGVVSGLTNSITFTQIENLNLGPNTASTSVLNAVGSSVENKLTGNAAANKLYGLGGNDQLYGNGGTDQLFGDIGNDTLSGGAGNDSLNGQDGNDRLIGGANKDVLSGGAGDDTFVFNNIGEMGSVDTSITWDVISDFATGDKIDLSALDANTATAANDAFRSVIGSTTAFTAAGQLKVVNGVLYGNTDADSTAEFAIQLTGITSLSTSDFIL